MDSTQLQAEVTALRLERDMRQMAEARNAELLQQRSKLLAALRDCVLVMERDLEGLKVIQPELNAARAAIAAVEQDHSGGATDMAAEIERLRPLADEVQAARHVMREQNRLLVELAASQAREEQLRSVAAVPEALTQEPLRGDEPIGPQASRADYVRGWNACRNAMLSAAPAAPAAPTCEWSRSDEGGWDGSCGIKWSFIDDGPMENGVRFCPKCGGAVKIDAAIQKGGA